MKYKVIFIIVVLIMVGVFIAARKRTVSEVSVLPVPSVSPQASVMLSPTSVKSITPPAPTNVPSTKISLIISSPSNGATVGNASLKVSGKTTAGAEVFVNESETKADANGNFSVTITLDEGDNYIIVMANDSDGNVAEAELTIIYDP
jgi:hypothetical protein